ncbi:MAG: allantoinase PuuE [Nitratireductor sp.]
MGNLPTDNLPPNHYPRDFAGHGRTMPNAAWPGGAKVAVQFVVNYEEGGENCVLHGDKASEAFLSEITGAQPWPGMRHWNMESIYEYGGRAGFWRLHRLFTESGIKPTVYGVATALMRAPEQLAAMQEAGWEIASHGLKWIDYRDHSREAEAADIAEAIRIHALATGERPTGWYTGRCSVNTVDLIAREGGFDWCSDTYDDDLPYWYDAHMDGSAGERPLLVIPYTLDANDMRFAIQAGYDHGEPFYQYLKDSFDALHAEGKSGSPKMMSIGLHCRLVGRPGRIGALRRFIEYVRSHEDAWTPTRAEIAAHWRRHFPWQSRIRPSRMAREEFITRYGGVFEHSAWIAERAWADELAPANDSAVGLHAALARQFRAASPDERLGVLNAHPDLAGKLAAAKKLTAESTAEQASAGLDALTDAERATFTELNTTYVARFGFPFIIAVKGLNKAQILEAFKTRINNDRDTEFSSACRQVEKIALLRLKDMLP